MKTLLLTAGLLAATGVIANTPDFTPKKDLDLCKLFPQLCKQLQSVPKELDSLTPYHPGTYLMSVDSLSVTNGNLVGITASGTANTTGWTNIRLVPRVNVVEPKDGIVTFDLYGTEPYMGGMAISPGNIAFTLLHKKSWMKGIRVVAGSNELVAKFGESIGSGGLVTF